jgi:putative restriction endonuclease
VTNIDQLLEVVYDLRRGRVGEHERPHKPVLLLSLLEMVDLGKMKGNRIPFGDELRDCFKAYFEIVRCADDKATIENPFYYLQGDQIWLVNTNQGRLQDQVSMKRLKEMGAVGSFPPDVWLLLQSELNREQVREGILCRFFSAKRPILREFINERLRRQSGSELAEEEKEFNSKRDGAFRRVVVDLYDYQCAACGLRIKLPLETITFVDAAHLIPFSESHNDHPSNGIALCKNHHWAMDRNLIAPGVDMKWRVAGSILSQRSTGEAELARLAGSPVLPPHDPQFSPSRDSLRWRMERLGA